MPEALDLISTLVMGSILPVATTLFARSPFSTLDNFVGSSFPPLLFVTIQAPRITTTKTKPMIKKTFRLHHFFLPLPFATAASRKGLLAPIALLSLVVTGPPDDWFQKSRRKSSGSRM